MKLSDEQRLRVIEWKKSIENLRNKALGFEPCGLSFEQLIKELNK